MGIAEEVLKRRGTSIGTVDGVESGPCLARIEVRPLPNGGASIDYEATSREQGLQHREHSLLSPGPDDRHRLTISMIDMPFLIELIESTDIAGRFVEREPLGPYELAVEIDIAVQGELTYAWWWAPRGEALIERSRATVSKPA